jgi:hypothetical protein
MYGLHHTYLSVVCSEPTPGRMSNTTSDSSCFLAVEQTSIDLTKMKTVQNIQSSFNLPKPNSTAGGIAAAVDAYDGTLVWTFANPTLHWQDVNVRQCDILHISSSAVMCAWGVRCGALVINPSLLRSWSCWIQHDACTTSAAALC